MNKLYLGLLGASIILSGCTYTSTENASLSGSISQKSTTTKNSGLMPGEGKGQPLDTSLAAKSYTGIAYASESSTQKLDIYIPSGSGSFPVIIAIHGGGFKMGSRTGGDLKSMFFGLSRGYAIVSVDYRLSGEALYPAAINDIQAAIRYIRANASTYNLDPDSIVVWGSSAGGHLAALAGTKGSVSEGTHVQAVVNWFGPIDFSLMDEQFMALGITPKMGATNTPTSAESVYLGKTIGTPEAAPLVREASPETYISADDPGFYIQHGTADANIPWTQSENLAKNLKKIIGDEKVVFETLEGAGHGGSQFDNTENLEKIFIFLETTLSR